MKKYLATTVIGVAFAFLAWAVLPFAFALADEIAGPAPDLNVSQFVLDDGRMTVQVANSGDVDFVGMFWNQIQWLDATGAILQEENYLFDGVIAAGGTVTVI